MKRYFLILPFLLLVNVLAFSQETKITGSIKDMETNEPVIRANMVVKGKLTGTIDDANGNFELTTGVKLPFTLAVSVIGCQKQEIEITDANVSITFDDRFR